MGSITYDFLNHSKLFDDEFLRSDFESLSEDSLYEMLQEYRKYVISEEETLNRELLKAQGLRLYIEKGQFSLNNLKQASLYVDQFVIEDPLFSKTALQSDAAAISKDILGFSNKLPRAEIASIVRKMKAAIPMVAVDYVKFVPSSRKTEPSIHLPIRYSETGFSDVLPEAVLNYCIDQKRVRSLHKIGSQWVRSETLEPSRGLDIQFRDFDSHQSFIFHLWDAEMFPTEDPDIFNSVQTMPDEPPSIERFKAWLDQSINSAAIDAVNEILNRAKTAASYESSLLVSSKFAAELLPIDTSISIETRAYNGTLSLDLPLIENASIEDLMNLRADEYAAFQNFRIELEKQFRSLKSLSPSDLSRAAEDAQHEFMNSQLPRLHKSWSNFRRGAKYKLIPSAFALFGAICGGPTVLAVGGIAASVLALLKDYSSKIKENPSYFLFKLPKGNKPELWSSNREDDQVSGDITYTHANIVRL